MRELRSGEGEKSLQFCTSFRYIVQDFGFFSTDYFSLIPWIFLFVAGYFLHRVLEEEGLNEKLFAKGNVPVLNWIGRHSLIVYLLHQPILYGLGILIFGL